MREPSVASVGAQIAAEMPNAAINNPARSIGIASEAEMSLSRPPTLRKLVATKKLPAMRTTRRASGIRKRMLSASCRRVDQSPAIVAAHRRQSLRQLARRLDRPLLREHQLCSRCRTLVAHGDCTAAAAVRLQRLLQGLDEVAVRLLRPAQHQPACVLLACVIDIERALRRQPPAFDVLVEAQRALDD